MSSVLITGIFCYQICHQLANVRLGTASLLLRRGCITRLGTKFLDKLRAILHDDLVQRFTISASFAKDRAVKQFALVISLVLITLPGGSAIGAGGR